MSTEDEAYLLAREKEGSLWRVKLPVSLVTDLQPALLFFVFIARLDFGFGKYVIIAVYLA